MVVRNTMLAALLVFSVGACTAEPERPSHNTVKAAAAKSFEGTDLTKKEINAITDCMATVILDSELSNEAVQLMVNPNTPKDKIHSPEDSAVINSEEFSEEYFNCFPDEKVSPKKDTPRTPKK